MDGGGVSEAILIASVPGLLGNGCVINKGIRPADGGVRLVSDIQIKIIKW